MVYGGFEDMTLKEQIVSKFNEFGTTLKMTVISNSSCIHY